MKQTDAIFANVKEVHQQAETEPQTLRLSLDSKATVLIGPFCRGWDFISTRGARRRPA